TSPAGCGVAISTASYGAEAIHCRTCWKQGCSVSWRARTSAMPELSVIPIAWYAFVDSRAARASAVSGVQPQTARERAEEAAGTAERVAGVFTGRAYGRALPLPIGECPRTVRGEPAEGRVGTSGFLVGDQGYPL